MKLPCRNHRCEAHVVPPGQIFDGRVTVNFLLKIVAATFVRFKAAMMISTQSYETLVLNNLHVEWRLCIDLFQIEL